MPRTNRNANTTTTPAQNGTPTDSANATTRTRTPASLETLDARLDEAEATALGRQVKYNAVKAELDRLLGPLPNREQISQVFDRATLLNAKLNEANAAYRDALSKRDARVAEMAQEIAPDVNQTPDEIEAEVEADNAPVNGVVAAAAA